MHAASRESLLLAEDKFKELALGMDSAGLSAFADELASLTRLLGREVGLRKHLAERSGASAATGNDAEDSASKHAVIDSLFGGKVGAPTLELLKVTASQRWSVSRDLAEALDRFARLAVLIDAERAGQIEEVEDELFRFGRTLDANPQLASLLADANTPVEGRIGLLDRVIGGKAGARTVRLLDQVVRRPQSTHFAAIVAELAELAAARRGESVAHVTAAAPLSGDQASRLATVLSRIYGRTISVQIDIDPEVLGGLQIAVGDEVIDGTIASRLAAAASQLPR